MKPDSGDRNARPSPGDDLSQEAYALLAQANLLRVRGRWPEAVDACRAALRLAPDSAAAQSLLGDIYENQGALEDAAQWYRLALDSSPGSAADRLKLDRLLGHQNAESGLPPAPLPRPATPERIVRGFAFAAALTALLIIALAFSAAHRHAALTARDPEMKTAPVVVAPAAAPTVPLRDSAEQSLLDALNAAPAFSGQGLTALDAQIDPRTGRNWLTVGLGATGAGRGGIARAALAAARAAAAAGTASDFTVRCVLPSAGGGGGGGTLVFVGDVARTSLPPVPADGSDSLAALSDDQAAALLTNLWWGLSAPALPS